MTSTTVIYSVAVPAPIAHGARRPQSPVAPSRWWGSGLPGPGRCICSTARPRRRSAFYDPRLGAVVVASHSPEYAIGQVIDLVIPQP